MATAQTHQEAATKAAANGTNMATASAQEGSRALFRLAGAALDEADRQIEDGMRMFGKIHEQVAVSRRNLLKLAEESIEGALDAARTMTSSFTSAMKGGLR
jgi:hypothetical protein